MPAPDSVLRLCDNFASHLDHYKSSGYNETEVRREFLDPFWKALGWDIDNEQGYADAYKDVIHEDAIKIGGYTKAPDYCFRIGGTRKFFLEAKKPAVNIKGDTAPAFQLRRYAWSANLPLSILSDFEELSIYDCRIRPDKGDKSTKARVDYFTFDKYPEHWEQISNIFSRDAVLRGSFDQYADSSKKKRGTTEVDDAFLDEIERWREILARNLALRNPQLSIRDLNYAVQKTIDRIIFLRICEDRGTEDYGRLKQVTESKDCWTSLRKQFSIADDRYNSGLFHFSDEKGRAGAPDILTPSLALDDKVIKDIVQHLYYPDSPYEFSVLPADILGQVYEQFLGKTIRLTNSHQAKIEEKPEVRKAGGVYYTPKYIVDYIVENTLGRLLNGADSKKPKPISVSKAAEIKVLDPACGSGSFLIVAYQYLLDWHRDQYTLNDDSLELDEDKVARNAKGKSPKIYQAAGGEWKLTTDERKRILLNNIHGVDIDSQAVEVSKLSLLLKVLEGETQQKSQRDFLQERQRILPDLGRNIQCGNSLIGPDFYDQPDLPELDDETRYRINVFDWEKAFPDVFEQGGFDCVVGNPPYVRMELFKESKGYLRNNYKSHEERADLYGYFLELLLSITRPTGKAGLIVSNKFLRAKYGKPLRSTLAASKRVESLTDFAGVPVFKGATVRTIVVNIGSESNDHVLYSSPPNRDEFEAITSGHSNVAKHASTNAVSISKKHLTSEPWLLLSDDERLLISSLLSKFTPLHIALDKEPLFGVKTGYNEAFIIDQHKRNQLVCANEQNTAATPPILFGKDIRRYKACQPSRYIIYLHGNNEPEQFPTILEELRPYKTRLEKRAAKQKWFQLQQPAESLCAELHQPKIIYPIIAPESRFTLDTTGAFVNDKCFVLQTNSLYFLGLLNSSIGNFFFKRTCACLEGFGQSYFEFRAQYVRKFPIRTIDFDNTSDLKKHDEMVSLVERMLALHEKKADEKNPDTLRHLDADIAHTDRQIDRLVYELYDLSDEEIAIVEAAK